MFMRYMVNILFSLFDTHLWGYSALRLIICGYGFLKRIQVVYLVSYIKLM